MISRKEHDEACIKALAMVKDAGILVRNDEKTAMQAVDFGFGKLSEEGAQILTLLETPRIAVKILVLFPWQTEPEHWHPSDQLGGGKEETIRVIQGTLYLCEEGADNLQHSCIPAGKEAYYSARFEHVLHAGDQITLQPDTKHWFQAQEKEVIFYSFSSQVSDETDRFSDPQVVRKTCIEEDVS